MLVSLVAVHRRAALVAALAADRRHRRADRATRSPPSPTARGARRMRSAPRSTAALAFALVGLGFVIANRAQPHQRRRRRADRDRRHRGHRRRASTAARASAAAACRSSCRCWPRPSPAPSGARSPGVLKAKAGTNEVISTLLLSFIAVWMLYGCVQSEALLRQPMTNSATLPESLRNSRRDQAAAAASPTLDMPLHLGLPLALVLAARRRRRPASARVFGLRLRAVGLNPVAARRAGMPIAPTIVGAMFARRRARRASPARFMLQGDQYCAEGAASRRATVSTASWSACSRAARSPACSPRRCCSASCARAASTWRWSPACRRALVLIDPGPDHRSRSRAARCGSKRKGGTR